MAPNELTNAAAGSSAGNASRTTPCRREPRLLGAIRTEYGLDSEPNLAELEALGEKWQPYRMWAAVYLRRTLTGGAGMMHSRASG